MSVNAFIAFGSNLGDREVHIRNALKTLDGFTGVTLIQVSPLYETEAEGFDEPAPPFLNGVAELKTERSANALLKILLEIESQCGRVRANPNVYQSRPIDLDLLVYGDVTIDEPNLIVPHPRMHDRWFVLAPFADIAPTLIVPNSGKTVAQALDSLGRDNRTSHLSGSRAWIDL